MYTCDEVAERYKVKVITVWEWIRKKKLNAIGDTSIDDFLRDL